MIFGVDVIIVAPGNVATPIWDKANASTSRPSPTRLTRPCSPG